MSNIEEEKNMSVKMKEQLQKELDIMDKKEQKTKGRNKWFYKE